MSKNRRKFRLWIFTPILMLGVLFGLVVPSISSLSVKAAGETKGGQIFVEPEAELTIDGGSINGGEAIYGGAVYLSKNATLTMTNGDIHSNSATYGGAIAMEAGVQATISGGKIRDNNGTYGAGIYNNGGSLNITGGTFSGNTGADIYNETGTLTLNGGEFSGEIYNNGTLDYYKATLNEGAKFKLNAPINIKGVPTEAINIELTDSLASIGTTIANIDESIASDFTLDKLNVTNMPVHAELKIQGGKVALVASKVAIKVTVNDSSMGSVNNSSFEVTYGETWTVNGDTITFSGGASVKATPATTTTSQNFSFVKWYNIDTTETLANAGTVTEAMNIRADFTGVARNYDVTFEATPDGYGTLNQTTLSVPYGTTWSVESNVLTIGGTAVTATPHAADTQWTYKFVKWSANTGEVTGPTTITATFDRDLNNYTITIASNNDLWGTVDKGTVSVPYGSKWSTSGDKLTFSNGSNEVVTAQPGAGDAQYAYEVASWAPATGTVEGATSITVTFRQTVRKYTITINVNTAGYGTVSQSSVENVPYGTSWSVASNVLTIKTTPEQTVTATASDQTPEFSYSFNNWTNGSGTVDGNEVITANFNRSVREYDVTFVIKETGYGSVNATSNKITVPYGTTWANASNVLTFTKPSNGGTVTVTATPTTAGKQYTYTFGSWGTPTGTVKAAVSINVNFTRTVNEYDVTFTIVQNGYGTVDAKDNKITVPYGTTWANSTNKLTFTKPSNGGTVTVTANPHDTTSEFSYAFTSWTSATGTVQDATSIMVTFTRTRRSYDVTFVISESGWGSVNNVNAQNKISLPYGTTWTTNSDKLTFVKPEAGGSVVITATPQAAGAQYKYSFTSWGADTGTVQANTTIQVNFKRDLVTYTISIAVNDSTRGTVSQSEVTDVPYGAIIKVGTSSNKVDINGTVVTANTKTQTAQYTYSFGSWTIPNNGSVNGAMTVTANFNATVRNYTVTFTTNNTAYGNVNTTEITSVPYGTTWSTSGAEFTLNLSTVKKVGVTLVTNNPQYSFKFTKWYNVTETKDLGASGSISGNITIRATFDIEATKTYTISITVVNGTYGKVDKTSVRNVPYGTTWTSSGSVLTINTATKQTITATTETMTNEYVYSFDGFTPASGTVQGNVSIQATFSRKENSFTITFEVNNSLYGSVSQTSVTGLHYGATWRRETMGYGPSWLYIYEGDKRITTIYAYENTSEPIDRYEYSFVGYSPAEGTVTGDVTIKVNFKAIEKTVIKAFSSGNGYNVFNEIYANTIGTLPTTSQQDMNMYGVNVTCGVFNYDGIQQILRPSDFYHTFSYWNIYQDNYIIVYEAVFESITLEEMGKRSGIFYDEHFDGVSLGYSDLMEDKYFIVGRSENYLEKVPEHEQIIDEAFLILLNIRLFYPNLYENYFQQFLRLSDLDVERFVDSTRDSGLVNFDFDDTITNTEFFMDHGCHIFLDINTRSNLAGNLSSFLYDYESHHPTGSIIDNMIIHEYPIGSEALPKHDLFVLSTYDMENFGDYGYSSFDDLLNDYNYGYYISKEADEILELSSYRSIEVIDYDFEFQNDMSWLDSLGGDIAFHVAGDKAGIISCDLDALFIIAEYMYSYYQYGEEDNPIYIYSFEYLYECGVLNWIFSDNYHDGLGENFVCVLSSTQKVSVQGISGEITLYDLMYSIINDIKSNKTSIFTSPDKTKREQYYKTVKEHEEYYAYSGFIKDNPYVNLYL